VNRDDLAQEFVDARLGRNQIAQPSALHEPFGLAEAYDVANAVSERWRGMGNQPRGIKIGLTYRPVWEKIGLRHPVWAPIYAEGIADGEISVADYVAPRIEVEVVLSLAALLEPGATRAEIARAVEWATLGFEIVDSHYPEWRLTPPDLVADFGCQAGLVLGDPVRVDGSDAPDLSQVEVGLVCDGEDIAKGSGMNVLDGPLSCLYELLSAPWAPTLRPGDLVATGSMTGRAHPVSAGQTWRITGAPSSPFGSRELRISP
jgi:2-oxo-3-hexenedioate decarboxylase